MSRSYEVKLDRADQHLQSLIDEIARWKLTNPYAISHEIDSETGDDIVRFNRIDQPPRLIAQLIGDCLHNLRCVLDHLVYDLAIANRGTLTDEESRETMFPIFISPDGFNARGLRRIRYVSLAVQTIIQSLQPYHTGDAAITHWLWLLEQLQNIDKHRALLLAVSAQHGVDATFPPLCRIQYIQFRSADLSIPNAEFARYRVVSTQDGARMKMDAKPIIDITINNRPAQGREIVDLLKRIRLHIIDAVLPVLSVLL